MNNTTEINEYSYDPNEKFWRSRVAEGYDLYVAGSPECVDEEALGFAKVVQYHATHLHEASLKYIEVFVERGKAEIVKESGLINVYCGYEKNFCRLELQFEDDIYGLWSVEFKRDEASCQFFPQSFSRKNW